MFLSPLEMKSNQWRSQECEIGGGLPSLASFLFSPPLSLLTGSGGITPGNFLKLKVLVGEF